MSEIRFDNQVVVVTGAGGGLGRGYALEIARRGGQVVVNDLGGAVEGGRGSSTMADQVVAEIIAAGGKAVASYDSVASESGAQNIIATALNTFGRVDALINNAGNMRMGLLVDSKVEDLQALLNVHLLGSYHTSKAAWQVMQQQGYGRIVFTASSAGIFGNPTQGCYGAAKAGVFGLMNTLAHEGRELGILCNAVMPVAFSRMTDKASEAIDEKVLAKAAEFLKRAENAMQPEFVSGLVTYLASNQCQVSHSVYSSCAGRVARVFVGVASGWQGSRSTPPSAEQIADNFAQINDLSSGYSTPSTPTEELGTVLGAS
ncbi:SDR family NAD(P)-dependent oxidoreductase [Halioxenophilus sp. WMMB6]|uniref:SDR family NAD(P)-dependent oxidoreductase n=1 Tax=Halioxenophilus sp. WMMB6 TaxID=3073815 RepID=UPI00295E8CCF|nr:SDR family NAD(P)-dependent oxidoreductase [Halioxenophilus sp. WMMB6]